MVVGCEGAALGGRRERTDHVGRERREVRSGLGVFGGSGGGVRDGRVRLAGTVDCAAVCWREVRAARVVRCSDSLQWLHIVDFMACLESRGASFG